jgi:hypothetical protein
MHSPLLILAENSEVSEDPPQDYEDDDAGAATASRQLSRTVSSGDTAQQLAHLISMEKRPGRGKDSDHRRVARIARVVPAQRRGASWNTAVGTPYRNTLHGHSVRTEWLTMRAQQE